MPAACGGVDGTDYEMEPVAEEVVTEVSNDGTVKIVDSEPETALVLQEAPGSSEIIVEIPQRGLGQMGSVSVRMGTIEKIEARMVEFEKARREKLALLWNVSFLKAFSLLPFASE